MSLLIFLAIAMAPGADWPAFRGPNYNGAVSAPDAFKQGFGLKTSWQKELGSAYSRVSIVGDAAVTMFSDGDQDFLIALSTRDGSEHWRFSIAETHKGHDGPHDGPLSTPVIDDGLVYGLSPLGRLFAVQLKDGKLVWERNIVDELGSGLPSFGLSASPVVVGDVLVICTGGKDSPGGLTGLHKKTGKTMWTAGKARTIYQSPILARFMGKQQLILVAYKQLIGVNPEDGKVLWQYEHGGKIHAGQAVIVGDDRLYIHGYDEARMLRANLQDDTVQFQQLWTSRDLSRNYNVPVYHEGHLYGFGGRFLTCINAETGKRVWRSRPPGEGFATLLGDHLAIYTRKGSLHIVEASPAGYVEKSALEILPGDHYTAPSFAGNQLFLRNMKGIAAVEVGQPDTSLLARETRGVLPYSRFAQSIARITTATDKQAAVNTFLEKQSRFPILEGDRMVHIVYQGKVQDVALMGQIIDDQQPMNRVPGTDLYYYSVELEPGAHTSYQFSVDFETVTDPLNPNKGPAFYGDEEHSILALNSWRDSDHLSEPKQSGTLEELQFKSEHTKTERIARVYLPPGYTNSNDRYPVLYVGLGKDAIERGLLPNTLSNLIHAGDMEPVIAVFVESHKDLGWTETRSRNTDAYGAMLREELVPLVDKTWRTRAQAEARVLMGHSDISPNLLLAAFDGEPTFSRVVTLSAQGEEILHNRLMDLPQLNDVSVRLEWGSHPHNHDNSKVVDWNQKLKKGLKKRGVKVEDYQEPIGNFWSNLRTRHDDILKRMFPPRGT